MGRVTKRMLSGVVFGALIAAVAALPVQAEQPGDMWITTKVKMQLLMDDTVDGLDIHVDTVDGGVTLHGKVASEAAKKHAAGRAREVEGVGDVRNLLAVVPEAARDEVEVSDDKLEKRVSTVLERDKALEDSDITIESVHDGVVLLSGDAKTLSAHRRALEDARSVDGVRQVASQIRSPDELSDEELWQEGGSRSAAQGMGGEVSDLWITTKVKTQLMTESGLSPLAINVDTHRGVVTLFGSVGTEDVKMRAGDVVHQPLLVLGPDFCILSANRAFHETFRVERSEFEGRLLSEAKESSWLTSALRSRLDAVITDGAGFEDFETIQEFSHVGPRRVVLSGRGVVMNDDEQPVLIVLGIEDAGPAVTKAHEGEGEA